MYASLAASALDSAAALAAARSEATTAQALLELSTALAEIVTIEEVAIKLARAVPAVVDCDRSLVCLFDAEGLMGTIAASYGYPPQMESFFQGFQFEVGDEAQANGGSVPRAGVGRAGDRQFPARERHGRCALGADLAERRRRRPGRGVGHA